MSQPRPKGRAARNLIYNSREMRRDENLNIKEKDGKEYERGGWTGEQGRGNGSTRVDAPFSLHRIGEKVKEGHKGDCQQRRGKSWRHLCELFRAN